MLSRILVFAIILGFMSCQNGGGDTLPNGYKYEKHTNLAGEKPKAGQVVTLDFQLINEKGEVLDDSRLVKDNTPSIKVPAEMTGTMKRNPLLALVQYMTVGDSATVIVPIDSLPNPPDNFKDNKYINYIVKLRTIEDEEAYKERTNAEQLKLRAAAQLKEESKKEEIKVYFDKYMAGGYKSTTTDLPNGLKVAIIENTENEKAMNGDFVAVQYYGFLRDGTSFDNSYRAGRPFTFKIGQGMAIKGWDLGIPEVPKGAQAILDIPYELAYGAAGNPPVIPAESDLIFYINVESINNK